MDKVIIDGVDVSECEHYRAEIETKMPYGEYEILKDKCHYSGIEIIQDCKGIKGCIYKQLQRLQAEYDDLHLSYAGCKTANTGLQEVNQKLEQENEQLKKSIDRIMQDKEIKTIDLDIAKENAELKAECERLKEELRTEKIYNSQIEELEESLQHARAENEHYRKEAYRLADGLNKTENLAFIYKQALQEIRDMADFKCALPSTELCHCKACDYADNIIDKISECIGVEQR